MLGSEGRSFKWNERQEHYNVNPFIQAAMVGLSGDAKANGLKGISFTQDEYKEQLKAILSNPKNGNLQALKSLVYDDIDGTSLNLQNYTDLVELLESDAPDIPLIKQKIVDYLAPALANVNSVGAAKYNKALEESKGEEESSYDQALSLYNQLKQDPIGYYETFTGVAPSWDRKSNIVKIYDGGELQFQYDLNNKAERGRFYKQLLNESQYLKGASAKEEEIRRIFDMLSMRTSFEAEKESSAEGQIINGEFVIDSQPDIDISDTLAEIQDQERRQQLKGRRELKGIKDRLQREQAGL
jgi:hypothetical protein